MVLLPLPFAPVARLFPFFCSIASMFLMRLVARRYLTEIAVPIAVGLFAMTDWLLYYSVEIKQYTSDVTLTLAALLLAAGHRPSRTEPTPVMSLRDWLVLTAFGTIGVWFSFPLALVLAGVGSYLILQAASRRAWHQTLGALAMSLGWATSFTLCYWVSQSIVAKDSFLPKFWGFAFLPFPPRSVAELEQVSLQTINLLNSPAGVLTPLGVIGSMFVAVTLFVLGAWSLGRKWKGGLFLLASPILFALVASVLHQYPFHGRLLLFLVPSVYLLVAGGAALASRPGGAKLTFAMGAFLFCQPALDVIWHRLVAPRLHGDYDSHGDVAHDLLDYLEGLEKTKKIEEMLERAKAAHLKKHDAAAFCRCAPVYSAVIDRSCRARRVERLSGLSLVIPGCRGGGSISCWLEDRKCQCLKVFVERCAGHPEGFLGCGPDAEAAIFDVGRDRPQAEAFHDLECPLNLGVGLEALGGVTSHILGLDRGGSRSKGNPSVAGSDPEGRFDGDVAQVRRDSCRARSTTAPARPRAAMALSLSRSGSICSP